MDEEKFKSVVIKIDREKSKIKSQVLIKEIRSVSSPVPNQQKLLQRLEEIPK